MIGINFFGPLYSFYSLIFFLTLSSAHANVGEAFGFGSRSASLGGAVVANGDEEGFASYSNPAALACNGENKFKFSFGILDMEPAFKPISNVIVENDYTSDRQTSGNVDTNYRNTLGQSIGASFDVVPEFHHLSLGTTLFFPINQIAYFDTGESFLPEYFLYRARTLRPLLELGAGAEIFPGFYFGTGLHFAFSLTTHGTVLLQTDQTKPSTMRYSASIKTKAAPYFGVLVIPNPSFSSGLVFRLPVQSSNTMSLDSGARALGGLPVLDFNFSALSALFYDPMSIEAGFSWAYTPVTRLSLQGDYLFWSRFVSPALSVTDSLTSTGGVNFSKGKNPNFEFKNILTPRIGHEWQIGNKTLRLGYAYHPSILKNLPTESGNFLDPPKHMLNIGLGWQFAKCKLDLHASYHLLVTQTITKSAGDENGVGAGNTKIGAPGYEAGGKIYGGGVTLSFAL